MPIERDNWKGALRALRGNQADLTLKTALKRSNAGGSGAFLGLDQDDQRYWIKVLNNPQHYRVCTNEQIVGRAAALIGSLAPRVNTIQITDDLAGWKFRDDRELLSGVAHASSAIESATETHVLENRDKDDNGRHHAEVIALYDWCWGSDPQWLTAQAEDQRCYSHDHGHYLPGGPNWNPDEVTRHIDAANLYPYAGNAFKSAIIEDISKRLEAVTHADLVTLLSAIPTSWMVSDDDLETIGYFLEFRAPEVARRLRERSEGRNS